MFLSPYCIFELRNVEKLTTPIKAGFRGIPTELELQDLNQQRASTNEKKIEIKTNCLIANRLPMRMKNVNKIIKNPVS